MTNAKRTISIVIPVFRNGRAIELTYQQIAELFSERLNEFEMEVVFVDDGSDDSSPKLIEKLCSADPRVRCIRFTRNFGQLPALICGLQEVMGDSAVCISADMQDPVELIAEMASAWRSGAEVVICHRMQRHDDISASLTSRLFYWLVRLSIPQIPQGGFDYILLDRKAIDSFNLLHFRNRFFQGDALWFGYKTHYIPYARQKRKIGKSQFTFRKRLKVSIDALLDASYLPVRFISFVGVIAAMGGFLYALQIIVAYFFMKLAFPGWAPIMVVMLVLGGTTMLSLGIIGEYIWRIYDEVRGKPLYIVRERINRFSGKLSK